MNAQSTLKARPLFEGPILRRAVVDSFHKLDPRQQIKNPVMFVVLVGAAFVTVLLVFNALAGRTANLGFELQIAL